MADVQVDELSIKLSSTLDAKLATNLKAITDGLTKLHNSLTAFSASSSAIKSVDLMVTEFNKLGASVDKINVDKINSLSGALGRLSTAGEKINKTFGGLSFSGAEKSLDRYRKKAESIGDSFAKSLGIEDTEGIDKAKQAVNELSEAIYKWKTAGAERPDTSGLVDVAKDYANALQYVSVDADKATSSVLEFIRAVNGSGNKILLPTEARGDRYYAQKRRTLGPAFTTDQSKGGTSLAHFISDYNSSSGGFIDPSLNEAEMFEELYKQVASARTELDSYNQAALRTSEAQQAITEEVRSTANDLAKLASQTANFNSMLNEMGVGGSSATAFTNLKDSLTGLSQFPNLPDLSALGNLSKSVRTFANENIQTAMANLPSVALGLKTGLDALQGVTVPDLTGISQISKAVKTFANPDINTAVANMPGVITGISELAHGLAGITVPDLDGISSLIKVIGGLGGKGISNAISNLPQLGNVTTQFANAMANLPSIPPTVISDIGLLQENLKKYSNKSVQGALPVLPQMGAAVKQLINDIATAPPIDPSIAQTIQGLASLNAQAIKGVIELSKESEKASKKVNLLGKAFKGVVGAAGGFVGAIGKGITALRNLRNHTTNLGQTGFAQLTKSIVMVRTALWGLRRVASLFTSSIDLAADLVEVNNVVDHVFGNYTTKIEELSKTSIQNFGISELTLKKYASQFQAMGMTMGITGDMVSDATNNIANMNSELVKNGKFIYENNGQMADMATTLAEWTADLASFYNLDYAEAAQKVQAIYSGQTRPLRSLGIDLTQANLKAWALANGLNADIENMTQAEKAALRFQYALSATSMVGSDFQNTIGTWSNQVRVLKEQFNALKTIIGTGLISALKPFVQSMNNALSGILDFAQSVLNALGKIFGWEVEIAKGGISMDDAVGDLADGLSDVGDAGNDAATGTGNATKALEEYKKQVLSFDELHMLSAPTENNPSGSDGSGGGSGSGSGGAGGGGMTSAGDVSVAFKRTKALYESEIDTLRELGTYIADTLTSTLNNIPWDSIQEKATAFGTGLADFLNGLFDTDTGLATALGNTVEGAINTAISVAFGFGERFDFTAVGTDFRLAVDSAIDGIDWPKALSAASSFGEGVANALNAFIKPETFNSVGKTIANYLGVRITAALKVSENFKFGNLGASIASAINGALETGKSQKYFKNLGKIVSNLIAGGLTALSTFINTTDWAGVRDAIIEVFSGFSWKDLKTAGQNLVKSLFKAVIKDLGGDNKTWVNVKTELKGLFESVDVFSEHVGEGLKWFYDNVLVPLGEFAISEAVPRFLDTLKASLNLINEVLEVANPALKLLWDNFLEPVTKFVADAFLHFWDNMNEGIEVCADILDKAKLNEKLGDLADAMQTIKDTYDKHIKPIVDAITPVIKFIVDIPVNGLHAISDALDGQSGPSGHSPSSRLGVEVELQKYQWNGFTSWLSGDPTGGDNSGQLKTNNTVGLSRESSWGGGFFPWMTGTEDGNTETTNEVSLAKAKNWVGKKLTQWLAGDDETTTTTNKIKLKKGDNWSGKTYKEYFTGDKKGQTSTKNSVDLSVNYKGYSSYKNLITQGVTSTTFSATASVTVPQVYKTISMTANISAVVFSQQARNNWLEITKNPFPGRANGGIFYGGSWHSIQGYALGGAPQTSQLFYARESGPELVGTIGNHTAVMNNDQIVSSVANGVYTAVRSAMASVSSGGNQAPINEITLMVDGEKMFRIVKRGEKSYNGRYSTVATVS